MKKILWLYFLTLVMPHWISAQILDDTSQTVYGLNTTRYFTEEDIFLNRESHRRIDTFLNDIHRYRYILYNNNYQQDLGNVGTALYPTFFQPAEEIGRTPGINIYNDYILDPASIKYYNTKSPFTELKYVQGTQRYADIYADFARNINPNFSAGFLIRRFTTDKIVASASRQRHTQHWSLGIQTALSTKDRRYKLVYNFTHFNHEVNEQGGIVPDSGQTKEDLIVYELANVWLDSAYTWERRNTHRLYHQFSLDTGIKANFKIYQVLERSLIKDRFEDRTLDQNLEYYPNAFFDSSNTFFQSDFDRLEQKTGVAGIYRGWQLAGHLRSRFLFSNLYEEWESEWFLGGAFTKSFKLKSEDTLFFDLRFDQMLDNDARNIGLLMGYKGFELNYVGINRRPAILENRIYMNHFIWDQNLKNVTSNTYKLSYALQGKKFFLKPRVRLDEIFNHIYYGRSATPEQADETIRVTSLGLDLNFHLNSWHFENKVNYSSLSGPDVIRFPEWLYNGRYYFSSGFRTNRIEFQIGFELTYRSTYYGNAYMPANFQFYLQDEFALDQFLIPDFFLNLHFRSADAFISVPYFTQGWASPGYFATPFYTGYTRPQIVEFGFRWRFYD